MSLRDPFGVIYPVKQLLVNALGWASFWPLCVSNRLVVEGAEKLRHLPETGVLFVSNHQTYYMDGIAIYHSVAYVDRPYLLRPKKSFYYVAAEETMKTRGPLPRLLAYTGAITVKRTWKQGERPIERELDALGIDKIGTALKNGWVLTFPQGTTAPQAPGRIGCAKMIKQFQPVVVPIVLDGLGDAFHRGSLRRKSKGVRIQVRYKDPLVIDHLQEPQAILDEVMAAIEQ